MATSRRFVLTIEIPVELIDVLRETMGHTIGAAVAKELAKTRQPTPSATPEAKGLVDLKAVARLLALSQRTVWGLAAGGKMPKPVRFGRSVRWPQEEILAWVNARCPPVSEWERARKPSGPS